MAGFMDNVYVVVFSHLRQALGHLKHAVSLGSGWAVLPSAVLV